MWEFPKIGGPQYGPQNTIVLIMGTPKKEPLILGSPHVELQGTWYVVYNFGTGPPSWVVIDLEPT